MSKRVVKWFHMNILILCLVVDTGADRSMTVGHSRLDTLSVGVCGKHHFHYSVNVCW